MKDKLIPLIIGLVLAGGALFLLRGYLEAQKVEVLQEARQAVVSVRENQVALFVARERIPVGSPLAASMLETVVVDRSQMNPRAVRYFSELEGKAASGNIERGQQITTDVLRTIRIDRESVETFSLVVPNGKRAYTVSPENLGDIIGLLRAGDHVDVIAVMAFPTGDGQGGTQMMNIPIFQDVMVLSVGNDYAGVKETLKKAKSGIQDFLSRPVNEEQEKKKAPAKASSIVLALDPGEANIASFVQENGKIKITLRYPTDEGKIDFNSAAQARVPVAPIVTMETFLQYLAAKGLINMPAPQEQKEPEPQGPQVEIYRGQEKEVKVLEK